MASILTNSTFSGTYKDDFDAEKGYHRVLFNPGKSLQARELTQMQTIIQEEIARFGRNIFKEGAVVNPGGPQIDNKYEFVKLNTLSDPLPTDTSTLLGTVFSSSNGNIKFRVLEVVESTVSDPATLYGQYIETSGEEVVEEAIRLEAGDTITNGTDTFTIQTTNTAVDPAVGVGTKFSNEIGDFFTQGHFVYAPKQSIILSKYSNTWSGTVGFKVIQDIVTVADDSSLYDNSGATLDLSAPGSDRYRIRLELTIKDDLDSDENFVYYAEVRDSEVIAEATVDDGYNKIMDTMAVRTFEESGNYVVRPFKVTFEESDDATKVRTNLSPGLAYINGYRVNIPSDLKLTLDKSQTYEEKNNEVVSADYGNYVIVDTLKGVPDIDGLTTVNLNSAITYGGTTLGTARVRYVEEDGSIYKFYLFDIQMSGSNSFRNVKSIGISTSSYGDLVLESDKAVLKETSNNNLLFALPTERPKSLTDVSLEVQREFTETLDGSGVATISLTATGEKFANTNDWIVVNTSDGGTIIPATIDGSGTVSVTITHAPSAGNNITVLAKVNKSAGTVRTKSKNTVSSSTFTTTTAGGITYIDLGVADVISVHDVRLTDVNGDDISSRFTFDNGQRDNFYEHGRLILNGGATNPTGNVYVEFSYFSHGASGSFFAVNSYTGQVDYADIPDHRLASGDVVNLRDVLDFRSIKEGSSFTTINELPATTTLIQADITYYLPRQDKLVVNTQGQVNIIKGEPSFTPKLPDTPVDSLLLFNIGLNPFTLSADDLTTQKFDYKRYTMADIGRLDERIEEVAEMATLSLLELDTANVAVFSSDGSARTKSGFLVDNFANQVFSATNEMDYRASIDPQNKLLRPTFTEDNIRMVYNPTKSSNVVLKGDNIYTSYTDVDYITQPMVSGYENINPFAVVTGEGFVTLSPASDEWKDIQYTAAKTVSGGTLINGVSAQLWNNWLWNWGGISLGGSATSTSSFDRVKTASLGDNMRDRHLRVQGTVSTTTTARVVSSETIREVIDDRVVDLALIPWMRSRRVAFRVQGLRPATRYFPYFDGRDISEWCVVKPFTRFADEPNDYGNLYRYATEHPDYDENALNGEEDSKVLVSDENGSLEGSFFIPSPNNVDMRFRTGVRHMTFLDVNGEYESATSNALSRADTEFESTGLLETRQKTIKSTRSVRASVTRRTTTIRNYYDPLAQSFIVTEPEGIYLTKVEVYFQSKDDVIPVQCQIRPMSDGTPTRDIVPGGIKFLNPVDVNIPVSQTQEAVIDTPTVFEFDEPLYLSAGEEYAIVLLAESVNYNVYIAETYSFQLGSTEKRISRQPYLGSLFKSQNGSTWTPVQTQDMAFKLHRANFSTADSKLVLENVDVPLYSLDTDSFMTTDGSDEVVVFQNDHGFDVNDIVAISGVETSIGGIATTNINGNRTIIEVDKDSYVFTAGASATSDAIGGGTTVLTTKNILMDTVVPFFETLTPQNTSIGYVGKFTTGKSLAGEEVRFQKDTTGIALMNKENYDFLSPRMIATNVMEESELGVGERSATIEINMSSVSPYVSPVVDLQRSSLFTISNRIDNQSAIVTDGYNTPINFVDETAPSGGSSLSKHITVPVVLAAASQGLKIMLAANCSSFANFDVYYRLAGDGDVLNDTEWELIQPEETVPTDDNPFIFRDYRYLVGGSDGLDTTFTEFQIKIVMNSKNTSRVPVIQDLRVLAMVD